MSTATRFWIAIVILLLSIVWRQGLLFVVSLVLLLALSVAWVWGRYCLDRVEYRRRLSQSRAFFGEEVELAIEIINRKLLPLAWIEIEDEIPSDLEPVKGRSVPSHKAGRSLLLNLLSLRPYERVRRRYRVRCDTRGLFTFGPTRLCSGDVFGFYSREAEVAQRDQLLVYPRVVPITRLGLPAKDPFGDRKTRQWIFEDPLRTVGVREYVYGDSPRRIHWKATARSQKLQVKVYEPTTSYRLMVFLNLNTYGQFWWWPGFDSDVLELSISVAASVANWAVEQGYQVGLCANSLLQGASERVKVPAGRDPEQLTQILEALAKTLPFASVPFESLLRAESHELPYGATLVLITAVLSDEILSAVLALRASGHRLALLLIGDDAPDLREPGITVYRIGAEARWRELPELALASEG